VLVLFSTIEVSTPLPRRKRVLRGFDLMEFSQERVSIVLVNSNLKHGAGRTQPNPWAFLIVHQLIRVDLSDGYAIQRPFGEAFAP
jgi:hypothetical protein